MDLTKKERLSFIYQLRILEKLYPEEAVYFARHRIALEDGYKFHYKWMVENLSDELSEEECLEVLEILNLYRAVYNTLGELPEDDELRGHFLAKFTGFDGNNETQLMSYVRYFIVELGRFEELSEGEYSTFNSHMPMLQTYRAMLQRWIDGGKSFHMSREQLATVLGAD
jgi:uncharacterized protein YfbU (UPF0304 family)